MSKNAKDRLIGWHRTLYSLSQCCTNNYTIFINSEAFFERFSVVRGLLWLHLQTDFRNEKILPWVPHRRANYPVGWGPRLAYEKAHPCLFSVSSLPLKTMTLSVSTIIDRYGNSGRQRVKS